MQATYQNSLGGDVFMKFMLDLNTIEKIKAHPEYLAWEKSAFNDKEDGSEEFKRFMEEHKNKSHIEIYLIGRLNVAKYTTISVPLEMLSIQMRHEMQMMKNNIKYDTKYSNKVVEYTPIDTVSNRIYIDKNNAIKIEFKFKAENLFNVLNGTATYTIYSNKKTESTIVYNNDIVGYIEQ